MFTVQREDELVEVWHPFIYDFHFHSHVFPHEFKFLVCKLGRANMAYGGEQSVVLVVICMYWGGVKNLILFSFQLQQATNPINLIYPNVFKFIYLYQLHPKLVGLHVIQWFSPA